MHQLCSIQQHSFAKNYLYDAMSDMFLKQITILTKSLEYQMLLYFSDFNNKYLQNLIHNKYITANILFF